MLVSRNLFFVAISFALLIIYAFYGIQARPIFFADEVINTARTADYANFAANYFDYSLRPLYRAFNQVATTLFGMKVSSLWLATTLVMALAAALIYRMTKVLLSPVSRSIIALSVLAFPLSAQIAFAGTPHGVSSIFPAIAMVMLVRELTAYLRDGEFSYVRVSLASFLSVLGLLSHPIQAASLAAFIGALVLVVVIKFVLSDDRAQDARKGGYLIASSLGMIILTLLVVDMVYRLTVGDARSSRLVEGWSYSYFNLWVGNTGAFGGDLAAYAKPFHFYFSMLISNHLPFVLAFVLLFASAFSLFVWRMAYDRMRSWEVAFFIPAGTVIVWLIVNSFVPMKPVYVVVGLLFSACVAIAFLIDYLLRAIGRPIIDVAAFAAFAAFAVYLGIDQISLRDNIAKKPRVIEQAYRFIDAMPEKNFVLPIETTNPASRLMRYCNYHALAGGKNVERVNGSADLLQSLQTAKTPTAVCSHVNSELRDTIAKAGFQPINKIGELEIWVNR